MKVRHLDPDAYRRWRSRLGPRDIGHVRRRLQMLRTHGVELGLPNVRFLGAGTWELRTSAGLRLYFAVAGDVATFVHYGDKDTQRLDIATAGKRIEAMR